MTDSEYKGKMGSEDVWHVCLTSPCILSSFLRKHGESKRDSVEDSVHGQSLKLVIKVNITQNSYHYPDTSSWRGLGISWTVHKCIQELSHVKPVDDL